MNLETLTTTQFMEAQKMAADNADCKPAFRELMQRLNENESVKGRLALDMLSFILAALAKGEPPIMLVVHALSFHSAVSRERNQVYLDRLEEIIMRSFQLAANVLEGTNRSPYDLCLRWCLASLRRWDRIRFENVVARLNRDLRPGRDRRSRIMLRYTKGSGG